MKRIRFIYAHLGSERLSPVVSIFKCNRDLIAGRQLPGGLGGLKFISEMASLTSEVEESGTNIATATR